MGGLRVVSVIIMVLMMIFCSFESSEASISKSVFKMIKKVNKGGPYTGLLVSKSSELKPLFDSPMFHRAEKHSHLDVAGRRFHIGHIGDRKMILAKTGKGMINAAVTTQLLCTLFSIKNILHYGLAGNADDRLNIGDITIPRHWAHTGFWNWQRYGDGPDDELSFEEKGYSTRDYGYLNFADYTNKTDGDEDTPDNFLNNIWYQPEEIFPTDGSHHESKDTIFWIPIASSLFELAKKLEGMRLEECINITTCLPKTPKVVTVKRGSSASIYLDNVAYKSFLNSKFQVSPVDMEGAAIALISHQHKIHFVAFKALHDDFATDHQESSANSSNEAISNKDIFLLLIENCIKVIIQFMINMEINNDLPTAPDDINIIISST